MQSTAPQAEIRAQAPTWGARSPRRHIHVTPQAVQGIDPSTPRDEGHGGLLRSGSCSFARAQQILPMNTYIGSGGAEHNGSPRPRRLGFIRCHPYLSVVSGRGCLDISLNHFIPLSPHLCKLLVQHTSNFIPSLIMSSRSTVRTPNNVALTQSSQVKPPAVTPLCSRVSSRLSKRESSSSCWALIACSAAIGHHIGAVQIPFDESPDSLQGGRAGPEGQREWYHR